MVLVVFEDEETPRFEPFSQTRHLSQLGWGTGTLLEAFRNLVSEDELMLWGRDAVESVTKEDARVEYNGSVSGEAVFLNSRAMPSNQLREILGRYRGSFAAFARESLVVARIRVRPSTRKLEPGVIDSRRARLLTRDADRHEVNPSFLFEGPWDMVASNGLGIAEEVRKREVSPLPDKVLLKGPPSSLRIADSAEVEGEVVFDTRPGPVIVDAGAVVESFSRISGPTYVGKSVRVKSALIRSGTSVFESCHVGGEVANSIFLPFSNKSHFGFVGDSMIGEWVNLGAGSTFSNLKNTYGSVRVFRSGRRVDTGMLHLGSFVGDMAKVSIGCMLYAGKSVGVASQVAGLVDEDVPSFTYYDGSSGRRVELRLDAVLETQRRMMERRGRTPSKAFEELIRGLHSSTRRDRRKARVVKGRIG